LCEIEVKNGKFDEKNRVFLSELWDLRMKKESVKMVVCWVMRRKEFGGEWRRS